MCLCPQCGSVVGGVTLKFRLVSMQAHHCRVCHKKWLACTLRGAYSLEELTEELSLLSNDDTFLPHQKKAILQFLKARILECGREGLEEREKARLARLAYYEAKFITEATQWVGNS